MKLACFFGCSFLSLAQPVHAQLQDPIIPPLRQPKPDEIRPVRPLPRLEEIMPLDLPSGLEQSELDPNLLVTVETITFTGNTVIKDDKITKALSRFIGKTILASELVKIEQSINELYESQGYIGSGAIIFDQSDAFSLQNATIRLQIIEKKISNITIVPKSKESGRIASYIRRNLSPLKGEILNEQVLSNKLRFILDKPSIKNVQAAIELTEFLNEAELQVQIETDQIFTAIATLNDKQSPQTGSIEGGLSLLHGNVSRNGDQAQVNIRKTDGTNLVGFSYRIPINSADGTIGLDYQFGDSKVIEGDSDELDLRSVSHSIALNFRQPILRQSSNLKFQELAVGLGIERFDKSDTFAGFSFPLSDSADDNGKTRSTVIKAYQDFFSRTESDTIVLQSELSYGLPLGTANDESFGEGEFLKFALYGEYSRSLSDKLTSSIRMSGQIADRDLISDQNFFLGGRNSVRGLRSGALSGDNGLSVSKELQIVVLERGRNRVEVVPYLDFGVASNISEKVFKATEFVASTGLVVRFRRSNQLFVSFEFGQPFLGDRNSRSSQFNFDIQWRIF